MLEILFSSLLILSFVLSSYSAFTFPRKLLEVTLLVVCHFHYRKVFLVKYVGSKMFVSKYLMGQRKCI